MMRVRGSGAKMQGRGRPALETMPTVLLGVSPIITKITISS